MRLDSRMITEKDGWQQGSHECSVGGAACRREQLKKEGKLLTGKAKAEAERLAAMRAQLLRQAEEKGGWQQGVGGWSGGVACVK